MMIEETPQLENVRKAFMTSSDDLRGALVMAADAATRVILRLEPQLEHPAKTFRCFYQYKQIGKGKRVTFAMCFA